MTGERRFMTIQQAAWTILKRSGSPLRAKDLAKIALEENMVSPSIAKNPIQSLAQTLERNIRMNTGNIPKLEFVYNEQGRCISLPKIDDSYDVTFTNEAKQYNEDALTQLVKINLPKDVLKKIRIYEISENHSNIEDSIISLIKKGLSLSSEEILEKIKNELENS